MFYENGVLKNFAKCKNNTPVLESVFLRSAALLKKETPAQVFSCEFCNFFSLRNIFFYRTLPVAASAKIYQLKNI